MYDTYYCHDEASAVLPEDVTVALLTHGAHFAKRWRGHPTHFRLTRRAYKPPKRSMTFAYAR